MNLKVKVVNKSKHDLPNYSTLLSAGMDLRADINEPITLLPNQRKLVPTNIHIQLPEGYEAQIRPRSGLALKNGISIVNSPGTIDCFSETSLVKTNEDDKDIKNLKINDIILSVNEKFEIEKDIITAIVDKGKQIVLIIETEDGLLEITENTLVYTTRGLLYAKELNLEDEIIHF